MYFSSNKEKICKNYLLFALIISVIEFIITPIVAACEVGYFSAWLISFFSPFASIYYWAVIAGAILCVLILNGKDFKGSERIVPILITFVLLSTAVNALTNIFSTAGFAADFGAKWYNWGEFCVGLFQLAAIGYLKFVAKYYKVFLEQIKELVNCFKSLKKDKKPTETKNEEAEESQPKIEDFDENEDEEETIIENEDKSDIINKESEEQ